MKRLHQKTPQPAAPCASAATGAAAAIGAVAKASRHQGGSRVQLHGQRVQCGAGQLEALRQELQKTWDEKNWSKEAWASRVKQIKKKQGAWGAMSHGGARKKAKPVTSIGGYTCAVDSGRLPSAIGDAVESERATSAIGDAAESDAAGSARAMSAIGDGRAAPVAILTPTKVPSSGPLQADPEPEEGLPETLPAAVATGARSRCSYTVIERLSGGAYGEVYTAKPKTPGSGFPPIFVIKVMQKTKERALITSEQLREIQMMNTLSHLT